MDLIKELVKYVFLTIAILAIIGNFNKIDQIQELNQNILATQTELQEVRLKNDNLMYERNSYIFEKNELIKELDLSKKEIKELESNLNSKIAYIAKLSSNVRVDTVNIVNEIIREDTTINAQFNYSDKWLTLQGETYITPTTSNTNINNIYLDVPLTLGLADNYKFFVTSPNPYVSFTEIDGSFVKDSELMKKDKGWEFGLQFGFGLNYGLFNKSFDIGPNLSLGIEYKF